jgi:trehalose-6-phosphate synthase
VGVKGARARRQPARGGMLHLVFNGHHVHVRASHVGIDADTLAVRLREDRVLQEQAAWRARFDAMGKAVVLVGYDDMEPLSGLTLKLKALQSMLALFPEYRTHTLLVQVPLPHPPRVQRGRKAWVKAWCAVGAWLLYVKRSSV